MPSVCLCMALKGSKRSLCTDKCSDPAHYAFMHRPANADPSLHGPKRRVRLQVDVDQSDINKAVNKAGAIIGTFTPGKTQVRPRAAWTFGHKHVPAALQYCCCARTSTTSCFSYGVLDWLFHLRSLALEAAEALQELSWAQDASIAAQAGC